MHFLSNYAVYMTSEKSIYCLNPSTISSNMRVNVSTSNISSCIIFHIATWCFPNTKFQTIFLGFTFLLNTMKIIGKMMSVKAKWNRGYLDCLCLPKHIRASRDVNIWSEFIFVSKINHTMQRLQLSALSGFVLCKVTPRARLPTWFNDTQCICSQFHTNAIEAYVEPSLALTPQIFEDHRKFQGKLDFELTYNYCCVKKTPSFAFFWVLSAEISHHFLVSVIWRTGVWVVSRFMQTAWSRCCSTPGTPVWQRDRHMDIFPMTRGTRALK